MPTQALKTDCNTTEYNVVKYVEQDREAQKCSYLGPKQFCRHFYRAMLCIRGTSHGPVSVCVCVRLSQVGVLLKRQNVGSHKHNHTIPQGLVFWRQRSPRNSTGVTTYRAPNAGGVGQNRRLSTNNRLYLENGKR